MGVAGATPPDVAARIGSLSLELSVGLARTLARHRHLDAGLALERGGHAAAPFLLDGTVEHQRALGPCGHWRGEQAAGKSEEHADPDPAPHLRPHLAKRRKSRFPDHGISLRIYDFCTG